MSNPLYQRHVISIADLTRHDLETVIATAQQLKREPRTDLLKDKVVASCFFEASTRTRLSFETAVQRLGGTVIGFDDGGNTSLAKKGETMADSVRIITSYVDAFVMRHPKDGAARLASENSSVPVINGGDGSNQHPSQTLLDLFTIHETQGKLDGLTLAFVGDLKYGRTVHSLAQALALFNCKFYFIAPEALAMPDYICEQLDAHGIEYQLAASIDEVVPELDILYMTRVQRERFFNEADYARLKDSYILDPEKMRLARADLCVLHPLPRVNEIALDVDDDPRAAYFEQVQNGVYVRMALIMMLLGLKDPDTGKEAALC